MALETQMIDVSLLRGVDNKMVDNTTLDPMFADIQNMRSDQIAGFVPRGGNTLVTSVATTAPAWVAATPTDSIYSHGRTVVFNSTENNLAAAPGSLRRRGFGSQLGTDPTWIAHCAHSSKTLTAWCYPTTGAGPQLSFQWYDPALDAPIYGGSAGLGTLSELQVTSGPTNAVIWAMTSAGTLLAISAPVGAAGSGLSVSNGGITITHFDVVYHSASSGWFMIYVEGANTKLVKYTLSGSTLTAGTPVTLTAAAAENVTLAMAAGSTGTTRIALAYYVSATGIVHTALYSTALTSVNTSTAVTVTATSVIKGLGVCDSLGASPAFYTFQTYTSSFLPTTYSGAIKTSGASTQNGGLPTPFGSISSPIALPDIDGLTFVPYVASVDLENAATYASAGFGPVTAGISVGITIYQSYRWSINSATGLLMHRGANIGTVGARYTIPQLWEGRVESITEPTAGFGTVSTQQQAGIVIINETTTASALATTFASYFPYGTAQIIAAGQAYGLDSQSAGPQGAWPIPSILASTFIASNGAGALTSLERYSYRLLKRWSDSTGNIVECVSPPFALTLGATDDTIDFSLHPQAFRLAQQAPPPGAYVQIRIYRTEGNGSIHYFNTAYSLSPVSTSIYAFTDVKADSDLDFSDALTYDGGELEDRELGQIRHMTTWQGRLVALTSDTDSTVYYSKPQEDYRGARFADGLSVTFPQANGGIVGIAGMDYTLYGFAPNEIFTVSGQPAGATGEDGSLGDPERRFEGIGCNNPKSILVSPKGVAFASDKGIYMILRNQELAFIGEGPFEDRTRAIVGAHVDQTHPELHYTLSNGVVWVYNWDQNLWTSFVLSDSPLGTAIQGTTPVFLGNTGLWKFSSTSTEVIPLVMTSTWIATTGIQGFQRVRNILLLLDYVAAHVLTINLYTDYNDTTPSQTFTINTATDISTTLPYQIRLHVQNQKCEAIRIKITSPTAGWKITGLGMEIGVKPDHYKPRTAANTF